MHPRVVKCSLRVYEGLSRFPFVVVEVNSLGKVEKVEDDEEVEEKTRPSSTLTSPL